MPTYLINVLPLVAAFFGGLFFLWHESRKDGFDEEHIIDLMLSCILAGFVTLWLGISIELKKPALNIYTFNLYYFTAGFALPILPLARKWRWSVYRLLDLIVLSLIGGLGFYLFFSPFAFVFNLRIFAVSLVLLAVGFVFSFYRNTVIKSGLLFCIVAFGLSVSIFILRKNLADLIFSSVLFTITLVISLVRIRKFYVSPGFSKTTSSKASK